jgi:hypothetical protein
MSRERRRCRRFHLRNEAFAAIIRPNEPVIVGKILNASRGGLAVRYIAPGRLGEGFARIRIIGPNLHPTDQIYGKVVYDEVLAEESWDTFSIRRCGIEFSQIA